jgi:hypothetical protein
VEVRKKHRVDELTCSKVFQGDTVLDWMHVFSSSYCTQESKPGGVRSAGIYLLLLGNEGKKPVQGRFGGYESLCSYYSVSPVVFASRSPPPVKQAASAISFALEIDQRLASPLTYLSNRNVAKILKQITKCSGMCGPP